MTFPQVIAGFHALFNVIGLPGNLLVIVTIALERRFHVMRHILLASLAVSDFLFLILYYSTKLSPNWWISAFPPASSPGGYKTFLSTPPPRGIQPAVISRKPHAFPQPHVNILSFSYTPHLFDLSASGTTPLNKLCRSTRLSLFRLWLCGRSVP